MTEPSGRDRPTVTPFLGALAIIVLVLIGVALFNAFGGEDLSDEQRVARATVAHNDALQRQDYADFQAYACKQLHGTAADFVAHQRDSVAKRGERFIDDVSDVVIEGDRATATVTYHFAKAPDDKKPVAMTFVREGGSWTVCSTGPR